MTINTFISENFHVVNNPTHKIEETELFVLADIHVPPFAIVHNLFIDMFAQDKSKVYIEGHEKEIKSRYTTKLKELEEKNRVLQKKYFDMEAQHFTTQFDKSIAEITEAMHPENIREFLQYAAETFEEGNTAFSNMITTYKNTENCFDFLIIGAFHIKGLVKENLGIPNVDIDAVANKIHVTVLSSKLLQGIIPKQVDKEKMG